MGFFVHRQGRFECVRCGKVSKAAIQTKLLRSEIDIISRGISFLADTSTASAQETSLLLRHWANWLAEDQRPFLWSRSLPVIKVDLVIRSIGL